MTETDILNMLAPIKEYILKNNIERGDIPVIVLNLFPPEERVILCADYFRHTFKDFQRLAPEEVLDRTREILQAALESAAYEVLEEKHPPSTYTIEEIEEELGDVDMDDQDWDYLGSLEIPPND